MKLRFILLLFCFVFFSGCSIFSQNVKTGLQVMTNDVPSSIFINGQFMEKTPLIDKTLPPGQYSLKIVPDDTTLVPYETTVVLRQGLLTVVTWKPGKSLETSGGVIYEMEKSTQKDTTQLSFSSIPDGVILTLDGGNKEFSPKVFSDISAGTHTFEATLPSYETQNHTLNAVQGYTMNIKIKLAKNDNDQNKIGPTPIPNASSSATATPSATAYKSATLTKGIKILKTDYFVNGTEVLKVRQQADAASPEIGTVEVGNIYTLLTEQDEWYQIKTDTIQGWVSKKYGEKID